MISDRLKNALNGKTAEEVRDVLKNEGFGFGELRIDNGNIIFDIYGVGLVIEMDDYKMKCIELERN